MAEEKKETSCRPSHRELRDMTEQTVCASLAGNPDSPCITNGCRLRPTLSPVDFVAIGKDGLTGVIVRCPADIFDILAHREAAWNGLFSRMYVATTQECLDGNGQFIPENWGIYRIEGAKVRRMRTAKKLPCPDASALCSLFRPQELRRLLTSAAHMPGVMATRLKESDLQWLAAGRLSLADIHAGLREAFQNRRGGCLRQANDDSVAFVQNIPQVVEPQACPRCHRKKPEMVNILMEKGFGWAVRCPVCRTAGKAMKTRKEAVGEWNRLESAKPR